MDFKIDNINIYGLEESISCMKYSFKETVELGKPTEKEINIASKLGKAPMGSGHDCYLKGIIVQFDVRAPHYWLPQFQRYHWIDFVMSQSKMHTLTKFDLDEYTCDWVSPVIMEEVHRLKARWEADKNSANWMTLLASCPLGLMLTARITTN
jgi:hypothetical protein